MNPDIERAIREAQDAVAGHGDRFIQGLAGRIGVHATAAAVFGEPVEQGGVTVVPVAKLRWGFGGGWGKDATSAEDGAKGDEGSGGGGGVMASPVGFIEISEDGAYFHRTRDLAAVAPVVAAAGFAAWLVLRGLRSLLRG